MQAEEGENMGTAYNRAYLASAIAYAKIPLQGFSDTLKTLGVIFEGSLFSNLDLTRRVKKIIK